VAVDPRNYMMYAHCFCFIFDFYCLSQQMRVSFIDEKDARAQFGDQYLRKLVEGIAPFAIVPVSGFCVGAAGMGESASMSCCGFFCPDVSLLHESSFFFCGFSALGVMRALLIEIEPDRQCSLKQFLFLPVVSVHLIPFLWFYSQPLLLLLLQKGSLVQDACSAAQTWSLKICPCLIPFMRSSLCFVYLPITASK
jgi:hypothetical protein